MTTYEAVTPTAAIPTDPAATSSLYNKDLAPTTPSQRTWSVWSITALWVSMCACIPTYMLASGLMKNGLNAWQAVVTIFLANLIVLIPMVLNAHAGTKYGIPFPVYCRASFGTLGANIPAMIRALVGCGWFGIQCWVGGNALLAIAGLFKPEWVAAGQHHFFYDYGEAGARGPTAPQLYAYGAFWLINLIVIVAGINTIRWLLNIKAPLLIALGFALLGWAYFKAHGFGDLLHSPSAFGTDWSHSRAFWTQFGLGLSGMVGFWATLSLNIPDFSRYAKSQRDQIVGQALGLPTTMALFAFISVAVTSATVVIFNGNMIDDPIKLIETFQSKWALGLSMAAVALATLATNIAANVVSPANDFAHLAPRVIGFRLGGLITGIVGTLMMPWYLLANSAVYIGTWLVGISGLLGAVGGILVCDYWLVRRARLSTLDLYRHDGRYEYDRGINFAALLAGTVAIAFCVPGFVDQATGGRVLDRQHTAGFVFEQFYNYSVFVTFAVALVVYAVLMGGHPNVRQPVELTLGEFTGEPDAGDAVAAAPAMAGPVEQDTPIYGTAATVRPATPVVDDDTYALEPPTRPTV